VVFVAFRLARLTVVGPASLKPEGARLLVPVNTLMAYRLSRIARSSAYLR
jgi:hypothetical protein